jgi:replicative DNA helicase
MAEPEVPRRPEAFVSALKSARDLPHNVEAEQAVLGALLLDENAFDQVAPLLKPGDFYLLPHQHIFDVCAALAAEAKTIDPVLVIQRLDAKGWLGTAVPRDLPWALARGLGTASNAGHYARVVQDLSRLRQMMLTAQRLVERGYESGGNVQHYLDAAQQDVFGAAAGTGLETLKPIQEPLLQAVDNLEAIQKRVQQGLSPITGVPTGLPTLDKMMLGLQPGALIVVAARPSVGKTAFALNIAAHAAVKQGKRVAVFSLEMPSDQLALRMLASEAKLDWRRLSQGMMSKLDWEKVSAHAERIGRAPIWLDDNFVLTPVELRSKCRKIKREQGGLDLVVIDYLQLMHAPNDRGVQSREQEIATISRSLKALSKELQVPVMALSQLNRSVEKRKGEAPMLSDLRESGAIEQDADVVMFLHREEADEKDGAPVAAGDTQQVQLIVAKQRQGPTGKVDLVFFKTNTFFAEVRGDGGG